MVRDGINDARAVETATCRGTPAIDRLSWPRAATSHVVTPGLRPVRVALEVARRVAKVRARKLSLALAYNVLTIALAYAGAMSPVLCAVLMPASSLTTVPSTAFALSPRSRTWTSSSSKYS
jgi:Cu2+-exporting ATPase